MGLLRKNNTMSKAEEPSTQDDIKEVHLEKQRFN